MQETLALVKRFQRLSSGEMIELIKELQRTVSIPTRNKIIEGNLRLIRHFVYQYTQEGIDLEELFQEGTFGLMHTYKGYDPEKGSFSHWAGYRIRSHIRWAIAREKARGMCKIYLARDAREIFGIERRLQKELKRSPTAKEISAETAKPIDFIVKCLELRSLINNKPMQTELAWQAAKPTLSPLDRLVAKEELEDYWRRVMDFLRWLMPNSLISPVNKKTFLLRYGLHDGSLIRTGMKEIGELMNGESRACIFERLKAVWEKAAFSERKENSEWMDEHLKAIESIESLLGDDSMRIKNYEEFKNL